MEIITHISFLINIHKSRLNDRHNIWKECYGYHDPSSWSINVVNAQLAKQMRELCGCKGLREKVSQLGQCRKILKLDTSDLNFITKKVTVNLNDIHNI